ncbi:MAG: class I SAM-dependent methyltransferase [Bacteroidota bacterium]
MTAKHLIKNYYHKHAPVYDITRWLFLFGRSALLRHLPHFSMPPAVIDVGCGTGTMTLPLTKLYPKGMVTGIDLSDHMLRLARRKSGPDSSIRFLNSDIDTFLEQSDTTFDLVVCSYSLTMMEYPEKRLDQIIEQASAGTFIAIVDFHDTRFPLFRAWMKRNLMTFTPSIFKNREPECTTLHHSVHLAYGGWWTYGMLVLQKR